MKVYVFGNKDTLFDSKASEVANILKEKVKNVEFIEVGLNEDLPFSENENVVILDTVDGITGVEVFHSEDLEKFSLSPKSTVHDFDLGFQLKYLKKIGKLGEITIIGLPMGKEPDYFLVQSILRKLVAQDMQGS